MLLSFIQLMALGSAGKNMSKETVSYWKSEGSDYALRANMTEAEFVKESNRWSIASSGLLWDGVAMNKRDMIVLNRC
jgi:hypothetical protein